MSRATTRLLFAAFVTAVLALTVFAGSAAAQTTYQLAGVEVAATNTTGFFQGPLVNVPGMWSATIVHEPLDKSPNAVTQIDAGGGFTITPLSGGTVAGSISGGQLVAQPAVGGQLCTQQFLVSGSLVPLAGGTGSFEGTLTHYGTREHGVCEAAFATFVGSVTL